MEKITETNSQKSNQGTTLYLTVAVIALILTISFSLAALFLAQNKFLRDMGFSVQALYAAETGIERTLYALSKGETGPTWSETLDNTASYTANYLLPGEGGCPTAVLNHCIKSIGAYKGVQRGIRVAR